VRQAALLLQAMRYAEAAARARLARWQMLLPPKGAPGPVCGVEELQQGREGEGAHGRGARDAQARRVADGQVRARGGLVRLD